MHRNILHNNAASSTCGTKTEVYFSIKVPFENSNQTNPWNVLKCKWTKQNEICASVPKAPTISIWWPGPFEQLAEDGGKFTESGEEYQKLM